jgi:hypothetical protein
MEISEKVLRQKNTVTVHERERERGRKKVEGNLMKI